MERLRYRSTSMVDLQAEMHERELLREARTSRDRGPVLRRRAAPMGLTLLRRRFLG
jgi:hypothetical protein